MRSASPSPRVAPRLLGASSSSAPHATPARLRLPPAVARRATQPGAARLGGKASGGEHLRRLGVLGELAILDKLRSHSVVHDADEEETQEDVGHAKELQEAAEAARAAESGAWAAVEGADVPLPPRER